MNKLIDLEQDAAPPISEVSLGEIMELVGRMIMVEEIIYELGVELREATDELNQLAGISIPSLMESAGLKELVLTDDRVLSIKPIFAASLPAPGTIDKARGEAKEELIERLRSGLKWLRANKHGAVIKKKLNVDLGKASAKPIKEITATLESLGFNDFTIGETVHPQTLKALLTEVLEKGEDVPFETFSIYNSSKAVIK